MRFLISFAVALAIATASVTGECSDRLSCNRELLAQLTAAGAYTEAAPSIVQGEYYSGGELGMVAKSFIAEGDIAISVPVEAIVMPPTCEDPFDDKHDDAIMYLTRCLLKTENPLFKQYLAALPEETTNLYAYTEEEFAEFQDGGLKDILELKREAMKEAFGNMTDLEVSFEELYAVYSKVVARSHTIPVKIEMQPGVFDWKYMPALVPLVDLMNQGIQNTACYTPERGDEFVCETMEEVLEGTELLVRYGARQMDNVRGLMNYGLLDDDLWEMTPFSVPMPPEIAALSEAKLEVAKTFHPHIADVVSDPYIALTAAQAPMVLHHTSIILGMERLACLPDDVVEALEEDEHKPLTQALSSCNATQWQHERAEEIIAQACECGHDNLINHFKRTLSAFPTSIEEDEAYLKQLQNQHTVAVEADGTTETSTATLSASDVRRINAVRWRMQQKRVSKIFEDTLVAGKNQE